MVPAWGVAACRGTSRGWKGCAGRSGGLSEPVTLLFMAAVGTWWILVDDGVVKANATNNATNALGPFPARAAQLEPRSGPGREDEPATRSHLRLSDHNNRSRRPKTPQSPVAARPWTPFRLFALLHRSCRRPGPEDAQVSVVFCLCSAARGTARGQQATTHEASPSNRPLPPRTAMSASHTRRTVLELHTPTPGRCPLTAPTRTPRGR